MTKDQQGPQFLDPKGGQCTQGFSVTLTDVKYSILQF